MKKTLRIVVVCWMVVQTAHAQITTPVIRAAFGVDGELRSQYTNGLVQIGNDDWFNLKTSTTDTGRFVIDTTGAAALVARYTSVPLSRRLPFYRGMRYPQFAVVNNRLLLDAVMVRDYHGDDSTVFASGANKNGDSPAAWSCPVSQGIPDKNDILDMFVHIRRAGPNATDSLWMFGGMSLDNTTGNRYFDFEMYQTDIYYNRPTRSFFGYGPDAGHTTWRFDAAGNITVPGDIIFSASYQSSSLTFIEARIWVDRASLNITPVSFSWSGQFDGDVNGAQYGYASIMPKVAGTYYTGLQCGNGTWGGPFSIVLQNDNLIANYIAGQFVEFSVNLTKLGLDPVTLLGGGNPCGMPFRRILVKTRASASFTAELKDFVGPFDLFLPNRVEVETQTPYMCDTGSVSNIYVRNPVSTSTYTWTTTNGNIVPPATGPSINVTMPGTYIVHQYLQAGCSEYAADTIQVLSFGNCEVLTRNMYDFRGVLNGRSANLNWDILFNQIVDYFDVERSLDGIHFTTVGRVTGTLTPAETTAYGFTDNLEAWTGPYVYYRIRMQEQGSVSRYSPIIRLLLRDATNHDITLLPNPAKDYVQIEAFASNAGELKLHLYSPEGKLITIRRWPVQKGLNVLSMDELSSLPRGMYNAVMFLGNEVYPKKLLLIR